MNAIVILLAAISFAVAFWGFMIPNRKLGRQFRWGGLSVGLITVLAPEIGVWIAGGFVVAGVFWFLKEMWHGLTHMRW